MITINGKVYKGNSISISNNKVIIDGKDVSGDHEDSKEININVEGNLDSLQVDACEKVIIAGNCGGVTTASGDVDVHGNIEGSIQTMSGDVDCDGSIGGSVSTMSGDIKSRNR